MHSGMGRPDWNESMVDIHLRKLLWVYCPGREGKPPSRETWRSEELRSLRRYLRAQSQGHHTIDHLEERGMERGSARWSSLKGREGHRQSDKRWNHFKGNVGETSERWGGAHMGFSVWIDTILNWTERNGTGLKMPKLTPVQDGIYIYIYISIGLEKPIHTSPTCVSQKFSQHYLWNSSNK